MGILDQFKTQRSNSTDGQHRGVPSDVERSPVSGPTVTVGSGSCDVQQEMWNVTNL